MYEYKIGNPNKVAQAYSWLASNVYALDSEELSKVNTKLESIVTPTQVFDLQDFESLEANWYLNLPVDQMQGTSQVVWAAEQIGQYGRYYAALVRSNHKPTTLFHLSAPDADRLEALIKYLSHYLDGRIKVSKDDLLIKIDRFETDEYPEGIDSFFNISFKRGKTYVG